VNLNDRELATVLAALREWQGILAGREPDGDYIDAIASDGRRLQPLTPAEIDELCERLNARKEVP
jgi:hypothetical protein